jgi:hypothetical protein
LPSWPSAREVGRASSCRISKRAVVGSVGFALVQFILWGRRAFLTNYETHEVGGRDHAECWIPARACRSGRRADIELHGVADWRRALGIAD